MEKIYKCPECGEKQKLSFDYDYSKQHRPVSRVWCISCGEVFDGDIPVAELSNQIEISDNEIIIGRFMNWFLKHYSTATIEGMFGYVNSMGEEVTIQDILKEYRKINGIMNS